MIVCYICRESWDGEYWSHYIWSQRKSGRVHAPSRASRRWSSKTRGIHQVWKSAADPDEDPPFIIEYWSSTTLPPMRNPKDHIQQHVQRESQGASLKEHGHSSRVTSRKGFVASRWNLALHRRRYKIKSAFRTRIHGCIARATCSF